MSIATLSVLLALVSGFAIGEDAAATPEGNAPSVAELNKQLANPVNSLWSIALQQKNYLIDPGTGKDLRWNSNLNFQPVMPVGITDDWNLITRPVVTAFNSVPHPRENVSPLERTPRRPAETAC